MRVTNFLFFCFLAFSMTQSASIKYVVVLMMENRSFDHLLGFLKHVNPMIDGLKGTEFNYYNVSNPSSPKQFVNQHGFDTGPDDPGHGFQDTAEQIYGYQINNATKGIPKMNGFAQNALGKGNTPYNPFSMFNISTAPVINTLALQYAVFDKWHCSLPGPTDPNRAFAMSGTSNGMIDNFNGTLWNQQSYFDFLSDRNVSWRAHYQDDPWAIMYFQDTNTAKNKQFVSEMSVFFAEVAAGSLPQFTWLQPRMTSQDGAPTWQHPDASVAAGEALIKQVYEALRGSKFWNELLFIITYDEHGGFYDHVAPPQTGIPSPDGVHASNGFTFDRLGIRLPTVMVSPLIPRGTVVGNPPAHMKPTPTSSYDATSTMATTNKIFGVKDHLGARSAWAATFDHILSLEEPRTDCPETLPEPEPVTEEDLMRQRSLPLNDHMETQVQFYCKFNELGPDCGKDIHNQLQASLFITEQAKIFMDKDPVDLKPILTE